MSNANKDLLQDIMSEEEITTISRNPRELVIANRTFALELSVIALTLRRIATELEQYTQQHTPLICLDFTRVLQKRLHNIRIDEQKYKNLIRSAMKQED